MKVVDMKASVALLIVFVTPVVLVDNECSVAERLRDTANITWFDAGEVQGFTIPNGLTKMCFFVNGINNSNESICDKASFFLDVYCGQNCKQHPMNRTLYYIDDTWLVNFRMLAPSATLDEAFVIRVYNDTLVYIVQEGHCNDNRSTLYNEWTPIRLLQGRSLPNCRESCANCTDTCKESEMKLPLGVITSAVFALIVVLQGVLLVICTCLTGRRTRQITENSCSQRAYCLTWTPPRDGNVAPENTSEGDSTQIPSDMETQHGPLTPSGQSNASLDSGQGTSPPFSTVTSSSTLPPVDELLKPN